jgi:hypothetical protein
VRASLHWVSEKYKKQITDNIKRQTKIIDLIELDKNGSKHLRELDKSSKPKTCTDWSVRIIE